MTRVRKAYQNTSLLNIFTLYDVPCTFVSANGAVAFYWPVYKRDGFDESQLAIQLATFSMLSCVFISFKRLSIRSVASELAEIAQY